MSANDTVLSDRALRRVEADGVVLEHNLETLRKQHDECEEDLEHVFTCSICFDVQADEPLDALVEPCVWTSISCRVLAGNAPNAHAQLQVCTEKCQGAEGSGV